MKKNLIFALAASILASTVAFAQQTTKLTAAKHNEYGLIYSLPVTHFDIVIDATKTVKTTGQFYKYAKKYLGVDNAIAENSQEWVINSITVEPFGVSDDNNKYLMQFKNGSSPYLIMNSKGLPMSINIESKEVIPFTPLSQATKNATMDANKNAKALPGELLVSESTAKKAEIAANMIYKIRESRTALATGEADQMPPDGAAMKLVMQQLDDQEAALMALFMGTTTTENAVKHIEYTPSVEVNDEVIARISDFYGIVDKNDLSGEPLYLSLKITKKGELPINEKGEEKKLPKGAVMYKIPGEAQITLKYNGKNILDKKLDVAQFGIDFGLDPGMFTDKKNPAYVIFNPENGSIKEIGNATPTN